TLNSTGAISNANGVNPTLSGVIGGSGGLRKDDNGTLTLQGANTFSGDSRALVGTLKLSNSLALQNSTFDHSNSGTLAFGGPTTYTLGGLKGNQDLALTNANGQAV